MQPVPPRVSRSPLAPILLPEAIEAESFRIIEAEMGPHEFSVIEWPVVQRAIHATADFDLGRSIVFHPRAVEAGMAAIPRSRRSLPLVACLIISQNASVESSRASGSLCR